MKNRSITRALITLVLVTAIGVAFGSEAYAATKWSRMSRPTPTTSVGTTSKPGVGPMVGEPDIPATGPLPPKDGTYPTGGGMSAWYMRLKLMGRIWTDIALGRLRH